MTQTATRLQPIPGPAAKTPEWYEARRHGVSATEVAKLAKGYTSDRRRILREKLTGERVDLAGKRAIEYGKLREPMIAAWVQRRFGIPGNDLLFLHPELSMYFATPDGFEVDPLTGLIYVSEIKTSEHDLTPGTIVEGVLKLTRGPGGKWFLYDNHFAKTGYYDQMQWQMFVTGADRTLFAWEQHDGDWSDWPQRAPKTITSEPGSCWVLRDDKRIAELRVIADAFREELETRLRELESGNTDVVPQLSEEEERELALQKRAQETKHEEARRLARQLVAHRQAVADAEAERDRVWKELQALLADETDWLDDDPDSPRISVLQSTPTRKVLDTEAMMAKHGAVIEKAERIRQRFTREVPGDPKITITVTKRKA